MVTSFSVVFSVLSDQTISVCSVLREKCVQEPLSQVIERDESQEVIASKLLPHATAVKPAALRPDISELNTSEVSVDDFKTIALAT